MRVGVVVLSVFAAIWCVAGLALAGLGSTFFYAIVALVSAAIIVAARRRPVSSGDSETGRRIGRLVGLASAGEGLAIVVAVLILQSLHAPDDIMPVIAIIVGVHFFAIAWGIPARLYYATGALLIAVGIVGLFVSDATRPIVVGVGAACILWLTAVVLLSRQADATLDARARNR
jgi:hypothetical protein